MSEGESMKELHLLEAGKKGEMIGPKKNHTERWIGVFVMCIVWVFVVALCEVCIHVYVAVKVLLIFCEVNGRMSVFSGNGDKEALPDSKQSV